MPHVPARLATAPNLPRRSQRSLSYAVQSTPPSRTHRIPAQASGAAAVAIKNHAGVAGGAKPAFTARAPDFALRLGVPVWMVSSSGAEQMMKLAAKHGISLERARGGRRMYGMLHMGEEHALQASVAARMARHSHWNWHWHWHWHWHAQRDRSSPGRETHPHGRVCAPLYSQAGQLTAPLPP